MVKFLKRIHGFFIEAGQGDGPGQHIRVAGPFFLPPPASPVPASPGLCPLSGERWCLA